MSIATEITRLQTAKADLKTAIEGKGVTVPSATLLDGYADLVDSISGGGGEDDNSIPLLKDVVFVDYDGSIVQNYTKAEFLAMSAMPSNPSHSGLVAQGWNWTLADAKEYVQENGILCVGQNYTTDDGKTRLYITVPENAVNVPATLQITTTVKNGVTIDWGDGNTTVTTANANSSGRYTHTYTQAGKYIVTMECTSGTYTLGQAVNGNGFTWFLAYNSDYSIFKAIVYAVEIGDNVTGMQGAFYDCPQLQTVSIPISLTQFINNCFGNSTVKCVVVPHGTTEIISYPFSASRTKFISIPKTVTNYLLVDSGAVSLLMATLPPIATLPGRTLFGCASLQKAAIPGTYTSIPSNFIRNCSSLGSITIPETVTSIATAAFTDTKSIKELHFLSETPPTLAGSSGVFTLQSFTKIYVPYSSDHSILDAYKTATNWSAIASYIEEEPQ